MDKMSAKEQIAFHQQQAALYAQIAAPWQKWNPSEIEHSGSFCEDMTKLALEHAKKAESLQAYLLSPLVSSLPMVDTECDTDPYKDLDEKHRKLFESDVRIMKDKVGVRFLNVLALFSISTVGQLMSQEPYAILREPGIGGTTKRYLAEWIKENIDLRVMMSGGPVNYDWYRFISSK